MERGIIGGATITQVEIYHLLKANPGRKMAASEIRVVLADGKGWNVQYFCQRLYEQGCIQREEFGTRRVYRYWIENGETK